MFSHRGFGRALSLTAWLLAQVLLSPMAVATPGDLDTTFGGDGKVTTAPARHGGLANAVALQADGRIVAVGTSFGSHPKFAVVRYRRDGTLDTTFGEDGTVMTNFAKDDSKGRAVAIQADGKIVTGGLVARTHSNWDFALARYNTDGTLDTTFGGDGKVTTSFGRGQDIALAVQVDGKIVVAGGSGIGGADSRFALARYNSDGTLDPTFGGDGKVTTDFTHHIDVANAVAIQSDGKIVAAGEARDRPALARYNTDGTLDPTFGGDGKVRLLVTCCPVFVAIFDATLQPDGKIVTAGEWFECFGAGDCDQDLMLVRFNEDGMLDATFGNGGIAFGSCGWANALALQADGKIVAAGVCVAGDFLVARYNTDGTLDTTFAKRGTARTTFTPNLDKAKGVAIQTDGKIVAAGGGAVFGSHPKFAIARYLSS